MLIWKSCMPQYGLVTGFFFFFLLYVPCCMNAIVFSLRANYFECACDCVFSF